MAGGVPQIYSGFWALLLAFLACLGAAWPGKVWRSVAMLAGGLLIVLVLPLATEHWLAVTFPVASALAVLFLGAVGVLGLQISDHQHKRSLVDPDTGLPNLKAFLPSVEGTGWRMIVARVDRYETLAATLGPAQTAALLQRIAERLAGIIGRQLYRIDEHSLAWVQPSDIDTAMLEHTLSDICAAMRAPIECGRLVDATLGLGIADPGCGGSQAVKQQVANAALAAERALRDRRPFLHFAEAQDEESGWHLSLMSELASAMEAGEVWNAYQPKLDIESGRVVGVETLVRWTHRERGPIGPDRFIPIVEANDQATELTKHVFRGALADAARWHARGQRLSVAVNVSATLLDDREFIGWLAEAIRGSAVDADMITVEVTESAAVKDVEQAAAALRIWRALGVAISIDDYGTGQSSLGYLQRLPASELKIDQSFIRNIVQDQRDAIMVRSTVALAHQLGMKVVAEGVEDADTLGVLKEVGCDVAQGWLIGRPMGAEALEAYLEEPFAEAA